ncbi:MAG: NAD(P)-dependent oxidoreductase [Methylovirgula sp.]
MSGWAGRKFPVPRDTEDMARPAVTHEAVTESDLAEALHARKIAGAAIDVFDHETLPPNRPFRAMTNVLATPHIGYVSRGLYETFYRDTVANIRHWLEESPTG